MSADDRTLARTLEERQVDGWMETRVGGIVRDFVIPINDDIYTVERTGWMINARVCWRAKDI